MMDKSKNKEVVAIVKLKSKLGAHKANITDDYQVIRGMLEQKLSIELLDQWIRKKQKETYISILPEWRGCDFEYPGWIHENN